MALTDEELDHIRGLPTQRDLVNLYQWCRKCQEAESPVTLDAIAKSMGMSSAYLYRRVDELEQSLGQTLFARARGQQADLLPDADGVLGRIESLLVGHRDLFDRGQPATVVRIKTDEEITGPRLLARILSELDPEGDGNEVRFRIDECPAGELLGQRTTAAGHDLIIALTKPGFRFGDDRCEQQDFPVSFGLLVPNNAVETDRSGEVGWGWSRAGAAAAGQHHHRAGEQARTGRRDRKVNGGPKSRFEFVRVSHPVFEGLLPPQARAVRHRTVSNFATAHQLVTSSKPGSPIQHITVTSPFALLEHEEKMADLILAENLDLDKAQISVVWVRHKAATQERQKRLELREKQVRRVFDRLCALVKAMVGTGDDAERRDMNYALSKYKRVAHTHTSAGGRCRWMTDGRIRLHVTPNRYLKGEYDYPEDVRFQIFGRYLNSLGPNNPGNKIHGLFRGLRHDSHEHFMYNFVLPDTKLGREPIVGTWAGVSTPDANPNQMAFDPSLGVMILLPDKWTGAKDELNALANKHARHLIRFRLPSAK